VALAGAVALLVLLNAIVAILVVDLACLLDAEDVVGFGNRDELGICRLVTTEMRQWTRWWGARLQGGTGQDRTGQDRTGQDRTGRTGSCQGGISCSACGRLS
jgi:hypothetical protein